MKRILIVEDEPDIQKLLRAYPIENTEDGVRAAVRFETDAVSGLAAGNMIG